MADKQTLAAIPAPVVSAPALKPSDMPEPAPQAPSPRARKVSAEPAFTDAGAPGGADSEVMDVNPTPRGERQAALASENAAYVPDPFGGKSGPQPLMGEDLARRGGGPDERVTKKQEDLVAKFRGDKAVQKLLRDEAAQRLGTVPKELEGAEVGLRQDAPPKDEPVGTTTGEPAADAAKPNTAVEVAAIAKEQRENRELRQRIKLAEGARTEAKRLEAWKLIAKDYPMAAAQAVLGIEPDAFYADDVQGRSKNAGDKIKVDPAALVAAEDKAAGRDAELEEERRLRRDAEGRLAFETATRTATAIAAEDRKRWALANTDPTIGRRVTTEVARLYRESDDKAGGPGKGWRPKDDAEAVEFTKTVLDDIEKHEQGEKKRLTSMDAAAPVRGKVPTPPPGQRPTNSPRPSDNFDRYARPPKRESVEDKQDRLISRYRGVSLTDE